MRIIQKYITNVLQKIQRILQHLYPFAIAHAAPCRSRTYNTKHTRPAPACVQVSSSAINITDVPAVRTDKTVQVHAQIVIPASRGNDGGAMAGFEANPLSLLPASFVGEFGITDVKVLRGNSNVAVVNQASTSGNDDGLSGGAIAGIVVGCVVGTVLIVVLIVILVRQRSKSRVVPLMDSKPVEVIAVESKQSPP
jgi:hypothetical protein